MKILIKTDIPRNFLEVFARFDLNLFKKLAPPLVRLEVLRFDGCKKGDEVHLKVSGKLWISHITADYQDDSQIYFVDMGYQIPYPLTYWKHVHRVESTGEKSSQVIDDIEFSTGNALTDRLIYPGIYVMFLLRKPVYKKELS
jgi:ligand-binding SRPBCC domain-containing protein